MTSYSTVVAVVWGRNEAAETALKVKGAKDKSRRTTSKLKDAQLNILKSWRGTFKHVSQL